MKIYRRRNKDGSLSPKYSYDFYIKGTRYRGSCYTTKRNEAIDYAEKIRRSIIDKVVFDIKNPSFNELLNLFVHNKKNYLDSLDKSQKSQFKLTSRLASNFFNNQEFSKDNINKFLLEIQNTRNLSDGTLLKYIAPLKTICKFAVAQNELSKNPFNEIDLTEINKYKNKDRVRFLSKAEYKELFEVLENNIIKDYIEFSINTGLRQGEQLALTWDRIDFEAETMYINKTKTDKPRTVILTEKSLQILKNRYNKNLEKPFPFKIGKVNDNWYKILKNTTIEDFRWHDLRHTFASWAVKGWHDWQNKPMELYRLKEWMGHSNIKMTLKYAHLCVDDLRVDIKKD